VESEYYEIHECSKHYLWYKNIFEELGYNKGAITINSDNKAAIFNCKNETINPKSKHIDLRFHRIRELVKGNQIKLNYIKSRDNLSVKDLHLKMYIPYTFNYVATIIT